MELHEYDAARYNRLNDAHQATLLLDAHGGGIEKLGAIILMHGLESSLGVALLHKHFKISSNEKVVRRDEKNESVAYPQPNRDLGLAPCLWKYDSVDGTG